MGLRDRVREFVTSIHFVPSLYIVGGCIFLPIGILLNDITVKQLSIILLSAGATLELILQLLQFIRR